MSDEVSFQDYVASERERLNGLRGQWQEVMNEGRAKLAELDREFEAINAYEAAKLGKSAPAKNASAPRARRGAVRESITEVLRESDGLARADLLQRFGVKGDRSAEMRVSNALTNMVKAGQIARENGVYFLPKAA